VVALAKAPGVALGLFCGLYKCWGDRNVVRMMMVGEVKDGLSSRRVNRRRKDNYGDQSVSATRQLATTKSVHKQPAPQTRLISHIWKMARRVLA
jgi:hypothetical protein